MLTELYSASEVEPMYFETEVERNAAFLILNSNTFYTYWITYGDFHHLNWSHVRPFPFPEVETLREHEDDIKELTERVWEGLEGCFDENEGITGEFSTGEIKPRIDEIDDLLADIYDLTDDQVEYVQNYLTDTAGGYGRVDTSGNDDDSDNEGEDKVDASTGDVSQEEQDGGEATATNTD
jgi:hypothetical protein